MKNTIISIGLLIASLCIFSSFTIALLSTKNHKITENNFVNISKGALNKILPENSFNSPPDSSKVNLKINNTFDVKIDTFYHAIAPNFRTPISQVEPIYFSAGLANIGTSPLTNVVLNMEVKDMGATTVYNNSLLIGDMMTSYATFNRVLPTTFVPTLTGLYNGNYVITSDEIDEDLPNNTVAINFEVTQNEFAKDNGQGLIPYAPNDPSITSWTIGNHYYIPKGSGFKVTEFGVGLANASDVGGLEIGFRLLKWVNTNGDGMATPDEREIIGFGDYEILGNETINTINLINVDDPNSPILLENDAHYLLVATMTTKEIKLAVTPNLNTQYATMGAAYSINGKSRYAAFEGPSDDLFTTTYSTTDEVPVLRMYIAPICKAEFQSTVNNSLCYSYNFTNQSTGNNLMYSWDFGDNSPIVTTASPTHTFPSHGNYSVTLTVTDNDGCTNSSTQQVQIDEIICAADFNASRDQFSCLGYYFSNQSTGCNLTYSWDFGDGSPVSSQENSTHVFPSYGTYTVTLNISGDNNCQATTSQVIQIENQLEAIIQAYGTATDSCCHTLGINTTRDVSKFEVEIITTGVTFANQTLNTNFKLDATSSSTKAIVTTNFPALPIPTGNHSNVINFCFDSEPQPVSFSVNWYFNPAEQPYLICKDTFEVNCIADDCHLNQSFVTFSTNLTSPTDANSPIYGYDEYGKGGIQDGDNFIILGESYAPTSTNLTTPNTQIIQLDNTGELTLDFVNNRNNNPISNHADYPQQFIKTACPDGYIISGTSGNTPATQSLILEKIQPNGTVSQAYNFTTSEAIRGSFITEASNGQYLMGGYTSHDNNGVQTKLFLAFGNNCDSPAPIGYTYDFGENVYPEAAIEVDLKTITAAPGPHYAITGKIENNMFVMIVDDSGNIFLNDLFEFELPQGSTIGVDILERSAGKYAILGNLTTGSGTRPFISEVNLLSNPLVADFTMDKVQEFNIGNSNSETANSFVLNAGTYVISGKAFSDSGISIPIDQAFLMAIKESDLSFQWAKRYTIAGFNTSFFEDIILTTDGGYFCTGSVGRTEFPSINYDIFAVKTDANGAVYDCQCYEDIPNVSTEVSSAVETAFSPTQASLTRTNTDFISAVSTIEQGFCDQYSCATMPWSQISFDISADTTGMCSTNANPTITITPALSAGFFPDNLDYDLDCDGNYEQTGKAWTDAITHNFSGPGSYPICIRGQKMLDGGIICDSIWMETIDIPNCPSGPYNCEPNPEIATFSTSLATQAIASIATDEWIYSGIQDCNGDFAILGILQQNAGPLQGNTPLTFAKLNQNGQLIGNAKKIDGTNTAIEFAKEYMDIIEVANCDGYIAVAGYTENGTKYDVMLLRFDQAGNKLWSKKLTATTNSNYSFKPKQIIQDSNGDYVIVGSRLDISTNLSLAFVMRWNENTGGNPDIYRYHPSGGMDVFGMAITEVSNLGNIQYVMTGQSDNKLMVFGINNTLIGNANKTYNLTANSTNDVGYSIKQIPGTTQLIVSGETANGFSSTWVVLKIEGTSNNFGNVNWAKKGLSGPSGRKEAAVEVGIKSATEYFFCGYLYENGDPSYNPSSKGFLINLDENGNENWSRTYSSNGDFINIFNCALTSDSGFALFGDSWTFNSNNAATYHDFWLAKTDEQGLLTTPNCFECSEIGQEYFTPTEITTSSASGLFSPTSSSDYLTSIFDVGVVNQSFCDEPTEPTKCDSIQISYTLIEETPADSCCFMLNVVNQIDACFTCVRLDALDGITLGNIGVSNEWHVQSYDKGNFAMICPDDGVLPAGERTDFVRICLSKFDTNTQKVKVSLFGNAPAYDTLCMDTLVFHCEPPPPVPKCVKIVNDTVFCDGLDQYRFEFDFMTDALVNFNVKMIQLNPPSGITLTPSQFLFTPPLSPNTVNGTYSSFISGGNPGDTLCFSVTAHDADLTTSDSLNAHNCCTDTLRQVCVVLPDIPMLTIPDQTICTTGNPFDLTTIEPAGQTGGDWYSTSGYVLNPTNVVINNNDIYTYNYFDIDGCVGTDEVLFTVEICAPCLLLSATVVAVNPPPSDVCCWNINLVNNYGPNYFTSVETELLTPNVIFGSVTNPLGSGWSSMISNDKKEIVWQPLPNGNFVPATTTLPKFCLDDIVNPNQTPQKIELRWMVNDSIVCRDTLEMGCAPIPLEDDCAELVNTSISCNGNGAYLYTFDIKNNTNIQMEGFELLNVSPTGSISPTNFSIPIPPNSTLTNQSVTITGNPNSQVCFKINLHDIADDHHFNCCFNDSLFCITLPDCGDPDPSCDIECFDILEWESGLPNNSSASFTMVERFNGKTIVSLNGAGPIPGNIFEFDGTNYTVVGDDLVGHINAFVVHDGRLFAGGLITSNGNGIGGAGSTTIHNLAVLEGSKWKDVGCGISSSSGRISVNSLLSSGGKLYVGGEFSHVGNNIPANNIAIWTGSNFTDCNSNWQALIENNVNGVNEGVRALAVYNNEIVIGGEFTSPGNEIISWNPTTSIWKQLGNGTDGGSSGVWALENYAGTLLVGGGFANVNNVNGSCVQNGVVAGTKAIAQWNGTCWSSITGGINSTNIWIGAIQAVGTEVLVGGNFSEIGGFSNINNMARWDGNRWHSMDFPDALVGSIQAIVNNDGICEIYAGGESDFVYLNAAYCDTICCQDSLAFVDKVDLGFTNYMDCETVSIFPNGLDSCHSSVWDWGDGTITGPTFAANGSAHTYAAAGTYTICMTTSEVGSNDDTCWVRTYCEDITLEGCTSCNTVCYDSPNWISLVPNASIIDIIEYQGKTIIGLKTAFSGTTNYIVEWDGTNLTQFGDGLNGAINDLEIHNGKLYAAGHFSGNVANSSSFAHLVVFNGTNWEAVNGAANISHSSQNAVVTALQSTADGLVAGGLFDHHINNKLVANIALWNDLTFKWERLHDKWNSIFGVAGKVTALGTYMGNLVVGGLFPGGVDIWDGTNWVRDARGVIYDNANPNRGIYAIMEYNNELYIGGDFKEVANFITLVPNTKSIAKWDGTIWTSVGDGVGSTPGTVSDFKILRGSLITVGNFTNIGGQAINSVARWTGYNWYDLAYTNNENLCVATCIKNASGNCELFVGGTNTPFQKVSLLCNYFDENNVSLDFDGEGDWVKMTNSPVAGNMDFTIEGWFLSEDADGINSCNDNFERLIGLGGTRLEIGECAGEFIMYEQSYTSYSGVNTLDGQWHHFAAVKEGLNLDVYLDGKVVMSRVVLTGFNLDNNFSIGKWAGGGFDDNSWAGQVDEIRVWNYARTEIELLSTFNSCLTGEEPGLVTYYNFEGGKPEGDNSEMTAVIDRSPNENNGVLQNFTLTGNNSNFLSAIPFECNAANCATDCTCSLDLTKTETTNITHQAGKDISSNSTIENEAVVEYIAGNTIVLQPGFKVLSGSEFFAHISPCAPATIKEEDNSFDWKKTTDFVEDIPKEEVSLIQLKIAPNPFNNQTKIDFYLPKDGNTHLSIRDINGRLLYPIIKGAKTKGWHQMEFNNTDLVTGMYYLVLQTEQEMVSKKIVVLSN